MQGFVHHEDAEHGDGGLLAEEGHRNNSECSHKCQPGRGGGSQQRECSEAEAGTQHISTANDAWTRVHM